jgi:hypothetical protein
VTVVVTATDASSRSAASITVLFSAVVLPGLININPRQGLRCHERASLKREVPMMKAGWKLFWLSVVVLAISFAAERILVPDVVPVGYAEEPQASWAVLTAFALRAIELTAEWVAAIALVLMLVSSVKAWLRPATSSPMQPAD